MDLAREIAKYNRVNEQRAQALAAVGVLALLGWGLALVARDARFILMASVVVALPAWFVVESWLALRPWAPPRTLASRSANALLVGVAFLAAFGYGFVTGARKFDWTVVAALAPFLVAFAVRAIYVWRDSRDRAIGLLTVTFERISIDAALVHFATYVIALAAALAAAASFESWAWRGPAYICGALIGKLAADFVHTKPPPLEIKPLSAGLMRMTALSPLWWGLPWAALGAGCFVVLGDSRGVATSALIRSSLPFASHAMVAVVFVFAAMTIVAHIHSLWSGARPASAQDEEDDTRLSSAHWAGLYFGVLLVAIAAYAVVFVPWWRTDQERFGVETWTCAKDQAQSELGWIAKTGLRIRALGEAGYIYFSDISCVPRKGGQSCDRDKGGWDEVEMIVRGGEFATTVVLNRKADGVHASPDDAAVFGSLATEFLWALAYRESAELKVKAPRGRLLYTKQMDLSGYGKAFGVCAARWRKEQGYRQSQR